MIRVLRVLRGYIPMIGFCATLKIHGIQKKNL